MTGKPGRRISWALAAILVLGLAAPFSVASTFRPRLPDRRAPREPEEGRRLFLLNCAPCHGRDARGIPNLGKDLVASSFVRRLTDNELIAFIERGRPANDSLNTTGVPMPPRGANPALTRASIKDIVVFLRTLSAK